MSADALLGAADIRALAAKLDIKPTKTWGQNFVIDANTVRSIVRISGVTEADNIVEVGPGLGSLTLALLPVGKSTTVIEIDPKLAAQIPLTVKSRLPECADRLNVVAMDAMKVTELPIAPTALVANLPYNVSVPVLLHLFTQFPTLQRALVMVQEEVADRLAAEPGSRTYGVPSVKARWFGEVKKAAKIGRNVFWPAPNVDSALVSIERHAVGPTGIDQSELFACVDAAFSQRRKMLRGALAQWAGSAAQAESILTAAGIDPTLRGEQLTVEDFIKIAQAKNARAGQS
ncbi:MAG: rRNA ((1518)-N(6)/adenine(1519)-N(6))-dimethyltransferase RsmA [Actinomycetota bacterium]|jgi:16S rRNA (adenine1518-N6/adenine1519-N6)-dimethyltransferase